MRPLREPNDKTGLNCEAAGIQSPVFIVMKQPAVIKHYNDTLFVKLLPWPIVKSDADPIICRHCHVISIVIIWKVGAFITSSYKMVSVK